MYEIIYMKYIKEFHITIVNLRDALIYLNKLNIKNEYSFIYYLKIISKGTIYTFL